MNMENPFLPNFDDGNQGYTGKSDNSQASAVANGPEESADDIDSYAQEENPANERPKIRAVIRPREVWLQPDAAKINSIFDSIKSAVAHIVSKEIAQKRQENTALAKEIHKKRSQNTELVFNYHPGSGIEGIISIGNHMAILAKDFMDCSGLVFQSKDGVGVLHISPNVLREPESGGEIVGDTDIYGHIRFALKKILADKKGSERSRGAVVLSESELEEIQIMIDSGEIKVTMLAGEPDLLPSISQEIAERANIHGLPFMKIATHYIGNLNGEKGYQIYATPESIYTAGSNNFVMKAGKNLPPEMFDFEEVK